MKERDQDTVPTYGLLVINHAYNEGQLTFKEWLKLSREWAEAMIRQYGQADEKTASCYNMDTSKEPD